MAKQTDSDHEQSSIPSWLKTTGAVVGILAALSGAIVGASQVVSSWKQFQLEMAEKERGEADAKFKEAAEETKKAEVEVQGRKDLKQKELDIKVTELSTATENRKSAEIALERDHQAQDAAEKSKIDGEGRANRREDEKQLMDHIGGLYGKNSSGSIAILSRHAQPDDKDLSTILTPLVAKLDDEIISSSEISIIFQLFNKSGPSALNAVLDANRIAFEKYKQDIKEIARVQLATEAKRRAEAGPPNPERDRYEIPRTVSNRITSTYGRSPGLARFIEQTVFDLANNSSSSASLADPISWEKLLDHSRLQLDILSQSKRSLLRLIDPTIKSLDLSGMDLTDVKFPRLDEAAVNFRGACLIGADLSRLSLDQLSILSIWEADFGQYARYGGAQRFRDAIFESVRLSEQQKSILSNPPSRLD